MVSMKMGYEYGVERLYALMILSQMTLGGFSTIYQHPLATYGDYLSAAMTRMGGCGCPGT